MEDELLEDYRSYSIEFLLFTAEDLKQMISHCLATGKTIGNLQQDWDALVKVMYEKNVIPKERDRTSEYFFKPEELGKRYRKSN